jgi:hypothetical protein
MFAEDLVALVKSKGVETMTKDQLHDLLKLKKGKVSGRKVELMQRVAKMYKLDASKIPAEPAKKIVEKKKASPVKVAVKVEAQNPAPAPAPTLALAQINSGGPKKKQTARKTGTGLNRRPQVFAANRFCVWYFNSMDRTS